MQDGEERKKERKKERKREREREREGGNMCLSNLFNLSISSLFPYSTILEVLKELYHGT